MAILTMSYLGLSYLGTPQPDTNHIPENTQDDIVGGFYGLLDYSSACWVFHLQRSFDKSNIAQEKDLLEELTETLEEFVEIHWSSGSKKLPVSASIQRMLSSLSKSDSHDRILQAVAWSKRQLGIHGQAPSNDEALDLWKRVDKVRGTLEDLSTSTISKEKRSSLEHHYGQKHFKCPRISCYYYHEGFSTARDRDSHIEKHERPFLCVVDGCLKATFGYANKAELTRHVFEQHGLDFDDDWDFPVIQEDSDNTDATPQPAGKFICPQCGKGFTRKHTLKLHIKRHAGEIEKPYKCYQCGMAFARNNDRKRHERQHGDGDKLLCFGRLDDGTEWGCRAEFTRRDKREDHFRSKKGRQCIMPFAKQKLLRDAEAGVPDGQTRSLVYDGDVMLPRFKEFLALCGFRSDVEDSSKDELQGYLPEVHRVE